MKLDPVSLHLAHVADAVMRLRERRRQEAIAMLRSCGVDPRTVPLGADMWREGRVVYIERFMFDEKGKPRRDDHDLMTEEFAIEPDFVPDWIPSE